MSEGTVVLFEDAMRQRQLDRPRIMTEADLELRREAPVSAKTCHAAFTDVAFDYMVKKRQVPVFDNLSVSFPRDRRIAVLGHKGSGKSSILDMLSGTAPPRRGRVAIYSRISWKLTKLSYFDGRMSTRQNILYLARLMDINAPHLIHYVRDLCDMSEKRLNEPMGAQKIDVRRRIGIIIAIAANFDCYLIDDRFKPEKFNLVGPAAPMGDFLLQRDYIITLSDTRFIPQTCDLAYILYESRIFKFDDVAKAIDVFKSLPIPEGESPSGAAEDDDEEDEAQEELL
ncbi:MAG: ATP-binding cassette domain-containing protein [Pseudomonadota bacterium]